MTDKTSSTKVSFTATNGSVLPSASFNLIAPGTADKFATNVHQMTSPVLRRHLVEWETRSDAKLPYTSADRLEIEAVLKVLRERLDSITPNIPVQIDDPAALCRAKIEERWPVELPKATRDVHNHLCELLYAWNINPFKREESKAVAVVDEYAEHFGITRFAFDDKCGGDDFIDHYDLQDFIVSQCDDVSANGLMWYVTLSNKFVTSDVNQFLDVYKDAMNSISVIHEERNRAIRNDGGRIGYAGVDHFTTREQHELNRITHARSMLGAGFKELNK